MGVGYGNVFRKIVTNGLVLCLDAGNTASYPGSGTTWRDLSGNGNNLTLFNSPTFTSNIGYFTFNGSTQYARRSVFYTSATAWSMSAIIRPANLNQLGLFMQNGRNDAVNAPFNGYGIGLGNGSSDLNSVSTGAKLQVIHGGVTFVNPEYTFASTSPWYYVVATRDTTTSTYYVNGTQTSLTSTSAPNAPTDVFSVGAGTSSTAAARYFAGDIAVVLFYSKQLSEAEIRQNFNATRGRYGI